MPKPFTQWWRKDYLYANEQDPTFSVRSRCYACEQKKPSVSDWNKLIRMMKYLNGTQDMKLTLSAENLWSIKMLCGRIIYSTSRLQKSNRRNNDIRKRSGTITIEEAEAQYKEQPPKQNSWEQTTSLPRYFGPSISWKHKDT